MHRNDAGDLKSHRLLHFFNRRCFSRTSLASIKSNHNAERRCALILNKCNRLTNRSTCCDDIVNNQNVPAKRGAHQNTALTVRFRFFTVEGNGQVIVVLGL